MWMITFTGKAFTPADPKPEQIDVRDIAHGLSNLCRYAGQTRRFYSVAEHCVLMCRAAKAEGQPHHVQLAALLHDAPEAYLVDVPRPVKALIKPHYSLAEMRVEDAITQALDLPDGQEWSFVGCGFGHPWVKEADGRIVADERAALLAPCPPGLTWTTREPLGVTIECWTPERAEYEYLSALRDFGIDTGEDAIGVELIPPPADPALLASANRAQAARLDEAEGLLMAALDGEADMDAIRAFLGFGGGRG